MHAVCLAFAITRIVMHERPERGVFLFTVRTFHSRQTHKRRGASGSFRVSPAPETSPMGRRTPLHLPVVSRRARRIPLALLLCWHSSFGAHGTDPPRCRRKVVRLCKLEHLQQFLIHLHTMHDMPLRTWHMGRFMPAAFCAPGIAAPCTYRSLPEPLQQRRAARRHHSQQSGCPWREFTVQRCCRTKYQA